ncbi:uncharacterized protein Z518_09754 [Rhinocladiella mackenziei CBS 650.93]|uniref:mRNA stability protein n=1 Tax=Rhinocladiella mackenziei CBS 650.93 TaxID=1442369 RepID=A0A0D2I4H1_9EURO|nr:uncharacterized protein Z518_09754 [Rhinocladiella mackenziei CBS 650.93]KIX00689.1 hypothetical protein Z518_09754 [Rhinocladiella mackenziei CBS 650.93]
MDQGKVNEGLNKPVTEHERRVYARFGSLPKQNILLRSQVKERKFFDSGDFAISQATNDSVTGHPQTGKQHPASNEIPHLSSPVPSDSNVKPDANTSQHRKVINSPRESTSPETDHQYEPGKEQSSKLARSLEYNQKESFGVTAQNSARNDSKAA